MAIRETHDCGRLFIHTMAVPTGGPLTELGTTHEVEQPWRVGRSVVLRVWKLALVVGWWGPRRTDEQMLADETRNVEFLADAPVTTKQIREDFRPAPGL